LKFGCALIDVAAPEQVFKIPRIGSNVEKEFSQVELANIIEPRVQEIFQLIRPEVFRLGYGDAPGGYVITGGAASMPGMLAHAQIELAASVRIAFPDYIGVRDASYTSGVGIIQFVSKSAKNRSTGYIKVTSPKKSIASKSSLIEKFKNWLSEYI